MLYYYHHCNYYLCTFIKFFGTDSGGDKIWSNKVQSMSGQLKANTFIINSFLSNRVIINAAIVLMRSRVNESMELCGQRFFDRPSGQRDGFAIIWIGYTLCSALCVDILALVLSFVLFALFSVMRSFVFVRLLNTQQLLINTHRMAHPHLLPLAHPYANLIACLPVHWSVHISIPKNVQFILLNTFDLNA